MEAWQSLAYRAALEKQRTARFRGFESYRFRQKKVNTLFKRYPHCIDIVMSDDKLGYPTMTPVGQRLHDGPNLIELHKF